MATQKSQAQKTGGGKKKWVDPFTRKEWFEIKAPDIFLNHKVGKMPINKSSGATLAEDDLKGRIVEVSLADLQKDEDQAHRKIKLRVEDVQGKYCLTNFYGMDFTTDKLRSLVRKWQTLIEAHAEVRTTDGYYLRLFCIGFTKRRTNQNSRTCYAQSSQVKAIRAKMMEIMTREATSCTLRELVLKFIPEAIGKMIERECNGIFPLSHVYIRKVKMLSSPKFDANTFAQLHDRANLPEDLGVPVEQPAAEPKKGGKKGGDKKEKPAGDAKGAGKKGGDTQKGGDTGKKGGDAQKSGDTGKKGGDTGKKGGDAQKGGAKKGGDEKKGGEKKGGK